MCALNSRTGPSQAPAFTASGDTGLQPIGHDAFQAARKVITVEDWPRSVGFIAPSGRGFVRSLGTWALPAALSVTHCIRMGRSLRTQTGRHGSCRRGRRVTRRGDAADPVMPPERVVGVRTRSSSAASTPGAVIRHYGATRV